MLPIESAGIFFAASLALAIAPGPDNIFVLTQSAMHGRKAGLLVTLGLCTGLLLHTTLVSVGVAAIFQSSTVAFTVLKSAGALYLLYLAWQAFRAGSTTIDPATQLPPDTRTLYYRGVVMNITNPKVALFFLAFLPQFCDPALGSVTMQMILLGGLFIVATLVIFGAIAWSAGLLGEWLSKSEKAVVAIHRIAGVLFVALALRLAIAEH